MKTIKQSILILSLSFFSHLGFAQWTNQTSGITNDLNDIYFINNSTGWAVGRQGTLLTTSNGGSTWTAQQSGITEDLNAVYMVNSSVGYAVGLKGKISKYNGTSWSAFNTGETRDIFGVSFIDANTGWAVGDWGRLYYTSNGGSLWTNQNNDAMASYKYNDVRMLSASEGWAVGTSGRIVKFDGTNWSAQTSGVTTELLGVHFLNANFGFTVGKNSTILFYDGSSWSTQNSGLGNTSDNIYDVYIVSANEAYAAVTPGFGGSGVILKYNGNTWSKNYEFNSAYEVTGSELFYGIHFPSASKGYAVGAGGMIKTNGSISGVRDVSANSEVKIYPNPSNGKFNVESKNSKGNIAIYNVVGEKVFETTIKEQSKNEIDIFNQAKGIYFLKVDDGQIILTQKIIVK